MRASPPPAARLRLAIALLALPLGLASCEGSEAFGMPAARLREILERGELEPILALGPAELAEPGAAGPAAYYYLARWLELRLPPPPAARPAPAPGQNGFPAQSPELPLPPVLREPGAGPEPTPPAPEEAAPSRPRELSLAEELYLLAQRKASGLVQAEAGRAYLALLARQARGAEPGSAEAGRAWEALLAAEPPRAEGARWEAQRLRLEALAALGRNAELRRELAELTAALPSEAAQARDELLYYEAAAALGLGMKAGPELLRELLSLPASAWTGAGLALLPRSGGAESLGLDPGLLAAARLRQAVRLRDYGAAYRSVQAALPLLLDPAAEPGLIAEAGKAFLYSGMSREGLALFDRLAAEQAQVGGEASRARAWQLGFYRARFLRALEAREEAAGLFLALEAGAPRAEDADACLWYAAESRIKAFAAAQALRAEAEEARFAKAEAAKPANRRLPASERARLQEEAEKARAAERRRAELAALLEGAPRWREPSRFSDLAEPLLREGLAARDWAFLEAYARGLGAFLSPTLGARALYIDARARELGYAASASLPAPTPPPPGPEASAAAADEAAAALAEGAARLAEARKGFRAVLERAGAPLYYRLLAARRLGEELALLPEAGAGKAEEAGRGSKARGEGAELRAFLEGFLDFGLGPAGFAEAQARLGLLEAEELRALAEAFSRAGRHADSMRLVLALMRRPDWEARRRDYELLYPRPFLGELRAIRPRPLAPEHLLFGLLRSESFFREDVVSHAGAVGLSQLMPATAAEVARAIGLGSYDLRKPADNLKIGFAFFGDLLEETGGRPLRAMFAYNAGRGRLRRWLAESGELPEDLLLEALGIEETRQYGRNILEAGAYYGALYYGMGPGEVVDGFIEGLALSRS